MKRDISNDPRYDAVGSSSLREELFTTYLKTFDSSKAHEDSERSEQDAIEAKRLRKERALQERAARVQADKERLQNEIGKSKKGLTREEGEREFMCARYFLDY